MLNGILVGDDKSQQCIMAMQVQAYMYVCTYICASSDGSGKFGKVLVLSFFLDLMLNLYVQPFA